MAGARTGRKLKALKARYKTSPCVLQMLSGYWPDIEASGQYPLLLTPA